MAGKYVPFEIYLADLPGSTYEITFTFEEIEKILAFKLPLSAYEDRRWWDHETEAITSLSAHGQMLAGRL
jgi:hypothetical protein